MDRRSFVLSSAAFCSGARFSESAPAAPRYPTRALHLIVNGVTGSPPDALARLLSAPLTALGQPVLVDSRRGGIDGMVAMDVVAKAAADGHTLAVFGLPQLVAPGLRPKLAYAFERAFAPVTLLVWTANVLVVSPSALVTSVAEVVAMAKAYPRELIYASAGCGTPSHLASALFLHHAGVQVGHLAYKGAPAALSAVMGQAVDFAFAGIATALPLIRAGKLRALATTSAQLLPALADVPTLAELGFAELHLNEWYAMAAPVATPADVVALLAHKLTGAVKRPDIGTRLAQIGLYPTATPGPQALAALIRAEVPRWERIVREVHIRLD